MLYFCTRLLLAPIPEGGSQAIGAKGCPFIKKLLQIHENMQSGSPFFSLSIAGAKKKMTKSAKKARKCMGY